ncbi:ABC transporter permease [Leucobacter triazinivorans]|uniref:ABC transporter permease n=1 Tax=Leucobacter triazinivorans TaxID=1784719 RepID=A0A4P6KF83_9MICO|nr:ABC transporter permease [Leucobacter triazinivorans]QBE49067.1 ABC transporter permease [Leucobacter triazinivorans]
MKKTETIALQQVAQEPPVKSRVLSLISFRNISAIYIFVVLFVIFALITPKTFLTAGTWLVLLDAQSITVLAAIAVLVPLVCGVFNLAIGAEVGFAVIFVAVLQVKLDLPWGLAAPLAILAGALIGIISGLLVTKAKIDSFIATLGMSSVLTAALAYLSESRQIIGLQDGFRMLATSGIPLSAANPNFKISTPVFIMLFVALLVWFVLERTPFGRRMYAVGYNPDGARLSGVNVDRIKIISLVVGGIIASLAGTLLASRINAGDPTVGPDMLLPALTAVFLGSTQFRGGRFNVWGTVVSVYVLAVGIKGLQLLGAQGWVSDLFNGVALLAAVGLSKWERTSRRAGAIRRVLPFRKKSSA